VIRESLAEGLHVAAASLTLSASATSLRGSSNPRIEAVRWTKPDPIAMGSLSPCRLRSLSMFRRRARCLMLALRFSSPISAGVKSLSVCIHSQRHRFGLHDSFGTGTRHDSGAVGTLQADARVRRGFLASFAQGWSLDRKDSRALATWS